MTSDSVHRYVIAYDITLDSRRTAVAKLLESYGDRLQYSVFLVDTKPARLLRLRTSITARLDRTEDSLLVCDLGPLVGGANRRIEFFGRRRPTTEHGPLVF